MVVTCEQMTIKHSIYMEKYPFYIQKGPVWFFSGIKICPRRKMMWSKVLQVLQTRGSTYNSSSASWSGEQRLALVLFTIIKSMLHF